MKKSRELNMSIPEVTDKIDVREISENFEIIDKILSANLVKRNTSTTEINVTAYPPYYIMKNTENNPIDYFDPIFEETFTLGPLEEKKFFINAPQSLYFTSDVQIEYDYFIPIQEAINDISIPDISASAINGNIKINGTETNVYTHPTGTNPHGTTKSDVGLGNVPNVATNDQTPSYTEASSLAKLTSGEKLSVAFGKISKGVTDLISHLADSVKHITSTERTNWNAAKTKADTNETNISSIVSYINNGDFSEDSTVAMTKTVPNDVKDYCAIKMIGGRTVKDEENQVLKNAVVESVVLVGKNLFDINALALNNPSKCTLINSNTVSVTGKYFVSLKIKLKPNTTYMLQGKILSSTAFKAIQINNSDDTATIKTIHQTGAVSFTTNDDSEYLIKLYSGNATAGTTIYSNVQIEEGSVKTAYSPYVETTLLIPDALKSLPDWGCAVSDEIYNWYDAENKVYHHRVGSVDLGSFTWNLNGTYAGGFGCSHNLSIGSYTMICDRYTALDRNFAWVSFETNPDKIIGTDSSYSSFMIKDLSLSSYDKKTFNNEIQGVMLNYELATEELIDISDILHPIRCEAGGTITFNNEHSLDVPNTIVYKKEVSLNE